MYTRLIIIAIFNILISNTFAQYFDVNYSDTPQGYLIESLSGIGIVSNVISDISNLSNANPASMVNYKTAQLGLSYQFESGIQFSDEPYNVEKKRGNNILPHSIGAVYKIKNTRIGLGISQFYNSNKVIGPYETIITSISSGTDTVCYEDYQNVQIFRSSILLSHTFSKLFSINDGLSIGIKYSYLHLKNERKILGDKSKTNFGSSGYCFGIRYDHEYSTNFRYSIGLKYEKGSKIKSKKTEAKIRLINSNNDTIIYRETNIGIVPDKIELGTMLSFNEKLSIILNSSIVLWKNYPVENILLYKYEYKNQIELNSSIIYQLYENIKISMGFFKTDFSYSATSTRYGSKTSDPYSALYLTIGCILRIRNTEIDVAFADSHLFSDELRKQTIFRIGINYFFNPM